MFRRMKVGMIVALESFGFCHVGRVVEIDDDAVTIEDAVRILYDGRHGEFAAGKPPESAEIEKTHSPYIISRDDIRAWAPYAGKIPKPQ